MTLTTLTMLRNLLVQVNINPGMENFLETAQAVQNALEELDRAIEEERRTIDQLDHQMRERQPQ